MKQFDKGLKDLIRNTSTIKILNIGTYMSEQTVYILIRLLL